MSRSLAVESAELPMSAEPKSSKLEATLERAFPGMNLELAALMSGATGLLVVYFIFSHRLWSAGFLEDWFRGIGGRVFARELSRLSWSHFMAVIWLLLVPSAAMWLFMGMSPRALGLRVRGIAREVALVLGLYVLFVPVIWHFSQSPAFASVYPRVRSVRGHADLFFVYQAIYLTKWVAWEFYFRGFMLFGLRPRLGNHAVLVSTLAFALMHIPKPTAELAAAIPAGYLLCWLALRSKSIFPGVLLHWMVAATMEWFGCTFWRG